MTERADIVVVGSGAFGASVAFHAATLGRSVVVVDRYEPVTQTSPRGAGLWQKVRHDKTTTTLVAKSLDMVLSFEQDTGEALAYHQVGSLKLAQTPATAEQLRGEVERGKSWGVDIDVVDVQEAERLAPYISGERAVAASWAPADIYVEAGDLPQGYLRAAKAREVSVLAGTTVTGITLNDGRVRGVETDRGPIETPVVINAAGAWAPAVAAMAGFRLCAVPVRHQMLVTPPIASVTADMPIVRVLDAHVYARPARGGLLFGGFEHDPVSFDPDELASGMAALTLDEAPLTRMAEGVADVYPGVRDAGIAEVIGGLPTMTPDGFHIFGPVESVPGFWIMSGCLVGGHSISPAIGEAMAQWIINDDPGYDMSRFRVDRFGPEWDDPDALRAIGLQRYANHYTTPERVR